MNMQKQVNRKVPPLARDDCSMILMYGHSKRVTNYPKVTNQKWFHIFVKNDRVLRTSELKPLRRLCTRSFSTVCDTGYIWGDRTPSREKFGRKFVLNAFVAFSPFLVFCEAIQ